MENFKAIHSMSSLGAIFTYDDMLIYSAKWCSKVIVLQNFPAEYFLVVVIRIIGLVFLCQQLV
jgi:hypothetical protein